MASMAMLVITRLGSDGSKAGNHHPHPLVPPEIIVEKGAGVPSSVNFLGWRDFTGRNMCIYIIYNI